MPEWNALNRFVARWRRALTVRWRMAMHHHRPWRYRARERVPASCQCRSRDYIASRLAREDTMAKTIPLTVNGKSHDLRVDDPQMPLLYALRNDLNLNGPRFGCGLAQCGSCTVHVDGRAVRSCRMPVSAAAGRKIVTLEGLGTPRKLHPLQEAFIQEQAVQCGYCINGMIMQAVDLLSKNKNPSEDEIRQALANNLCRCGTHVRIVRAVKRASETPQSCRPRSPTRFTTRSACGCARCRSRRTRCSPD
jgi:nicotinate dehydrogenase subunit A